MTSFAAIVNQPATPSLYSIRYDHGISGTLYICSMLPFDLRFSEPQARPRNALAATNGDNSPPMDYRKGNEAHLVELLVSIRAFGCVGRRAQCRSELTRASDWAAQSRCTTIPRCERAACPRGNGCSPNNTQVAATATITKL